MSLEASHQRSQRGPIEANWFIRRPNEVLGPLTESQLKRALRKDESESLQVRQGQGAWVDASIVRKKILELENNGIFLRIGNRAAGPYTIEKAVQEIERLGKRDVRVRTGPKGKWVRSNDWLSAVRRLQERSQKAEEAPEVFIAKLVESTHESSSPVDQPPQAVSENPIASQGTNENTGPAFPTSVPELHIETEGSTLTSRRRRKPESELGDIAKKGISALLTVIAAVGFFYLRRMQRERRMERIFGSSEPEEVMVEDTSSVSVAPAPSITRNSPPRIKPDNEQTFTPQQSFGPQQPFAQGKFERAAPPEPPTLEAGTVFIPRFGTEEASIAMGMASAVRFADAGDTYLLSCLHLFSPYGGLEKQLSDREVVEQWRSLDLFDLVSERTYESLSFKPLLVDSTAPIPNRSDRGDIVACKLTDTSNGEFRPLVLSKTRAFPTDTIWLLGNPNDENPKVLQAKVTESDKTFFKFELKDAAELTGMSGAPIVNVRGEVVGIQAGGSKSSGFMRQAMATHISCFADQLR